MPGVANSGPADGMAGGFPCPLSFAQERLWFAHQLDPTDPGYHLVWTFQATGPLDADALRLALNEVVARHEVLRARFVAERGKPTQWIADTLSLPLPVTDLRHLSEHERDAAAVRWVDEAERRPFGLDRGPLVTAALLRLTEHTHLLAIRLHHIVADAWSIEVLLRELGAGYRRPPDAVGPAQPALQYPDFAAWQRERHASGALEPALAYWRQRLAGARAARLPRSPATRRTQPHRAGSQPVELTHDTAAAVRTLAAAHAVTPYMCLLAAFCVLLRHYCGRDDVVLAVPVADRPEPGLADSVGPYLNTVVLRVDTSGDPSFLDLLARVRDACLDAQANQDAPFEHVVRELRAAGTAEPPVEVFFVLHSGGTPELRLTGVAVRRTDRPPQPPPMELVVVLIDEGRRLHGRFDYADELFDTPMMAGMVERFAAILDEAVHQPHRRLAELAPAAPVIRFPADTPAESPPEPHATGPVAPRTAAAITAMWSETRELDGIDADDDFFDLGGASLIAVQIIARIQERFGVELTVRQFFENPTVAEQAALVGEL